MLSGDGVWQVKGVDVEEKGCQDGCLWDGILEASFVACNCGKIYMCKF